MYNINEFNQIDEVIKAFVLLLLISLTHVTYYKIVLRYVEKFDVCIVDEATQCTEPDTIVPLNFNFNSLILIGDTQQLPGTVFSKVLFIFLFQIILIT